MASSDILRLVVRGRARRFLGAVAVFGSVAGGCNDAAFRTIREGSAGGSAGAETWSDFEEEAGSASTASPATAQGGGAAGTMSTNTSSGGLPDTGAPPLGGAGSHLGGGAGMAGGGNDGALMPAGGGSGSSGSGGAGGTVAGAGGASGASMGGGGGRAGSAGMGGGGTASAGSGAAGAPPVTLPFVESFEDGNVDDWKLYTVNVYQYSILPGTGARNTARSLLLTKTQSTDYCCDGFNRQFPAGLKPRSVSFWLRADVVGADAGYFRINASTDATSWIAYAYFYKNNLYVTAAQSVSIAYTAGRWYHVEYRKMDWDAHTFEVWLDGQQLGMLDMNAAAASIKRIDLYARAIATTPSGAYIDEIELRP